jgi:hypothetical protein
MEDGQYIFIRNIGYASGPGFISTSTDNNNKLMRSKFNEITENIDLNLGILYIHVFSFPYVFHSIPTVRPFEVYFHVFPVL